MRQSFGQNRLLSSTCVALVERTTGEEGWLAQGDSTSPPALRHIGSAACASVQPHGIAADDLRRLDGGGVRPQGCWCYPAKHSGSPTALRLIIPVHCSSRDHRATQSAAMHAPLRGSPLAGRSRRLAATHTSVFHRPAHPSPHRVARPFCDACRLACACVLPGGNSARAPEAMLPRKQPLRVSP